MPDEIKVDAAKFDRILGRMLAAKPLSKEEISNRVKTERESKKAAAFKKFKARREAKKLGQ
ncbi:MAG: hypothetical protein ACLPXB_17530 [Thiobacillaceae bacterium]